jgi:Phosphorylase superfamily
LRFIQRKVSQPETGVFMIATRDWVHRVLGFDPTEVLAPTGGARPGRAAAPSSASLEDIQREIIDFDSDGPDGRDFLLFSKATGLSRFTDIPWPKGLAPTTDKVVRKGGRGALPKTDVLIVTWTVDEGHALSRVLTPGKDSSNDYVPYRRNFAKIAKKMRKGCPALEANRLGAYWTSKIGAKKIVVFKSDSHLSQDTKIAPKAGETLPNEDVWRQIIEDTQPQLVITTGTAGGIGKSCQVGDVVVSPVVSFDCQKWLKNEPFGQEIFRNSRRTSRKLSIAKQLFKANAGQLPPDNARQPRISLGKSKVSGVVTTDFFGFDTSDNHFGLRGAGAVSEMGDAVLGLLRSGSPEKVPQWVCVRNVSDPQIKAEGTLREQAQRAAAIYKGFGRWSSVCSAIVCWALIA